jgi:CRISPR-associated endonuclease/helicase Cas3
VHYAHSTATSNGADWHSLQDHLRQTARRAKILGNKFGAAKAAALAGLLHDLGKYSQAYQNYIAGRGPGGVDHSTAGAQALLQLGLKGQDKGMAELIVYAIAGHHTGLPDMFGETGSLVDRLKKTVAPLDPIWREELELDPTGLAPTNIKPIAGIGGLQLAFLGRMIFSCLVEADFLDTEAFHAGIDGRHIDRNWPALPDDVGRMIAGFDQHMFEKQRTSADTLLNRLRVEVLSHVRQKARLPQGIFTLNVPTGGGKTLASLGFALDHAQHWQMDRIVYAIPFTSIIDQTAAIFRDILGEGVILEHHASIEPATADLEERFRASTPNVKLRLAMENWQAPVVVTTNVQLFESLFANRSSRCRKLHNLANAVIILDEAQTIPLHVLRPCVAALDELARNYGCSIVLCTATQPALMAPRFPGGFEAGVELAPDPARLHRSLKRTTERLAGVMTDEDLIAEFSTVGQALTIVNSRRHALSLYQSAKLAGIDGLIHLTTRQTASDRRQILRDVRERLQNRKPCRLIATTLVEAGVDIDFPRVWRAEAGLDQFTQAAGRCNREGRRPVEDSIVTIFKPAEARAPAEINGLIGDMRRILGRHHGDLFSPQTIEAYFQEVYWRKGPRLLRGSGDGLDTHAVLKQFKVGLEGTDFNYRSVAECFHLIESAMQPVIVALEEEPKAILDALQKGLLPPRAAARQLQNYVVQAWPKDRARLVENGHVQYVEGFADQFAVLKTATIYSRETGLVWEQADIFEDII